MATKIGFSLSCSPFHHHKLRLSQLVNRQSVAHLTICDEDKSYQYVHRVPKLRGRLRKRQNVLVAVFEDRSRISGLQNAFLVPKNHDSSAEDIFPISNSASHLSENYGKIGMVSFRDPASSKNNQGTLSNSERTLNIILFFLGPPLLFASFIVPPRYLPFVLLRTFGDYSFTIYVVLFFIEVISYVGVAFFLLLLEHLMRSIRLELDPSANSSDTHTLKRICCVSALVLGFAIPIFVIWWAWPWTSGPAIAGALTPYLFGILVQIKFEHQAKYWKSSSLAAIAFIFNVFRLHQLYKASHVLRYTSFDLRGTQVYDTLKYAFVLQILVEICIWCFSSYLMRFLHYAFVTSSSDANSM